MAQQLSSRLNRLLTLLDTGSTQATRLTAARQSGDLSSLLRQCHNYTTKSEGGGGSVKKPIESFLIRYRSARSFSVTDLLEALWCEKQMELKLHFGLREMTDDMKRGIAIHAWIDKAHKSARGYCTEVDIDIDSQKAAFWAKEVFQYIKNIVQLMGMKSIDVDPYVLGNDLNPFSELKLLACVEGQWIIGKMDLVEMDGVELQLIDYKSTKGGKPSYGPVRERQEYQLMLYKLIWDSLVKGEFQLNDFMDHFGLPAGLVLPEELRGEIATLGGFHATTVEEVVSKYLNIFKYLPLMSEQMYLRYLDKDQLVGSLKRRRFRKYKEEEVSYNHEVVMTKFRKGVSFWRSEREMSVNTDTSAPAEDSSQGLGKISEQKGILGPGPADLRFSEAI